MNLRFYVIYTPESFQILKPAIKSLLLHSSFRFTLVANGLSSNEVIQLQSFSQLNNRLSFIDLPGNVIVPHGTALNHLLSFHDEEYFCFCDSDIFATKNFEQSVLDGIQQHDVFSSCKPLEWTIKEDKRGYRGHCVVSPSGLPLAMTYFSVYHTDKLKQTISRHRISLERYMRPEQIPPELIPKISREDQHNFKFNTAKLINLFQALDGQKLNYSPVTELIHLGGISRYSVHNIEGTRKQINPSNTVATDRVASRHYFYQLLELFNSQNFDGNFPPLDLHHVDFQSAIHECSQQLVHLVSLLDQVRTRDI